MQFPTCFCFYTLCMRKSFYCHWYQVLYHVQNMELLAEDSFDSSDRNQKKIKNSVKLFIANAVFSPRTVSIWDSKEILSRLLIDLVDTSTQSKLYNLHTFTNDMTVSFIYKNYVWQMFFSMKILHYIDHIDQKKPEFDFMVSLYSKDVYSQISRPSQRCSCLICYFIPTLSLFLKNKWVCLSLDAQLFLFTQKE